MKRYAELELYMGICDSRGISESNLMGLPRVMSVIREYLEAVEYKFPFVNLEYGYFRFVRDENEARELIKFTTNNIPNSIEKIEFLDAKHGKIRFLRKIEIKNVSKKDKKNLIDIINKSNLGPINYDNGFGQEEMWNRALKFY